MCGICGIVNRDRNDAVSASLLERMTSLIAHRGPDDEGFHLHQNVGLGFRRLSIIDLAGGHQPIYNEDGSAVIVFNGEIYNYAGLSERLSALGHRFRTRSDTETIIHAYEQYGEGCLEYLRGMFAFALWDERNRRLFIARDRLGKKPLYYYQDSRLFAFASEIKALLEVPGVPREVDHEALDLYLALRYVPGPRTMFRGIHKLQPGHFLVLDAAGLRVQPYWDIRYGPPDSTSLADCLSKFQQLLDESVQLRLISEVPLGVFLSGGLDSSAILAVMRKIRDRNKDNEPIKTFSVGYEGSGAEEADSNELHYARLAATAFGAEHHEYRLGATGFRDFVPTLVWHLDEPLADPSCIPLYFISRLAREHITVVLSGEGADEVLAGYGIYRRMLALERVHGTAAVAAGLANVLSRLAPGEKVRHYLRLAGLPLEMRYRGVSRGMMPQLRRGLLNGAAKGSDVLDELYQSYFAAAAGANTLDRMLYVDAKLWLPEDLLMKADKMTMATSLELRVPFLDHQLVEFAATLPPEFKLNHGSGKFLLRQAMQDVLPAAILHRPKKGFPVPTRGWLGKQLCGFAREALLASDSACRRYLNHSALEGIVRQNEEGRPERNQEIWTLLVFEFWHRVFIERSVAPAPAGSSRLRSSQQVAAALPAQNG